MARLSEATGRTVIYNNLGQTVRDPDAWKKHMARVEETSKAGIRAYPAVQPEPHHAALHDANCQIFRGSPTWHPILLSLTKKNCAPTAIPASAQKLHEEVVEHNGRGPGCRLLA